MFVAEGREAFHVVVGYLESVPAQFAEGGVHIAGVPQHDCVDDESEGTELIFLTLTLALAKLPAVAVEDVSGERMAALGAVELGQDSSPVAVVIEVGEEVEGFRYPAKFCHRTAQRGWPASSLQDAKKL